MPVPVKVLHLGSPGGLYGAERWIVSLISYLDGNAIHSSVGVINDGAYENMPLLDRAEQLGLPAMAIQAPGRFNIGAIRRLREIIRREKIDIVHTHFYKTDLIGLLAARGTHCKVLTTPHGWTEQPTLSLRLYEALARWSYRYMDAVVPLSDRLFDQLSRYGGVRSRLHLIRNAVDLAEASAQHEIAVPVAQLRKQGKSIVGYVGRLTAGKGLDTLFRAVAQHVPEHWHVAIVGEGELAGELEACARRLGIANRVHFFGFREDRLAFMKGFDVFALPSHSEGIPRCVMESMAIGVTVIGSDIPGCRQLIEDGKTGFLFPVDNAVALGRLISNVGESTDSELEITRAARQYVEDKFSMSRMALEYTALYKALNGSPEDQTRPRPPA